MCESLSSKHDTIGVGVGVGEAPTVMVTVAGESLSFPRVSVTYNFAVETPFAVYVCEIVGFDCVTKLVSPKSKVYDAIASPASGSEEAEPSKFTVSGAEPDSGAALSTAVGAVCGRQKLLPTSV